jgi:hypothetical protein
MDDIISRPVLAGPQLDTAIEHARAALTALLCVPAGGAGPAGPAGGAGGDGGGYPTVIAEARALLGTLLDHRLALAAARMDVRDAAALSAARADRDEAIAVTGALLYWLPPGDPAWPGVALRVGRLSYDRYRDSWPGAAPPDPDDLDAACDLLLRAARYDEADDRTAVYLVLALGDRQRLMPCPSDANALASWTRRLHAYTDYDGGFGPANPQGLRDLLDLELASRSDFLAQAGSWGPYGLRPLRLAGPPSSPPSANSPAPHRHR